MICDNRIKNLQIKLVSIRCKGQVCFSCLLFKFLQFKMFRWPFMIWVIHGQNECYTGSVKVLAQLILFENLFKPRQLRLAVYMLLTSSVLSTTSKRCFEQPVASFLVCSLIFIEYKIKRTFRRKSYEEKNICHFHLVSDHVHLSISA